MRLDCRESALRRKIADMRRAYTAPRKIPETTGGAEAKMIVARVVLMSAMLTAGLVEATRTTAPLPAGEARREIPAEVPVLAPSESPLVVSPATPASAAPADPACTQAAWPYRPGSCLQPEGAEPRRPVRMIEERRPAAPVRMPGRVSVG